MARGLDEAGVFQIEAGCPAMGGAEAEAVGAVARAVRRARVSAWNRLDLGDVLASMRAGPDLIHVCFPVSEGQLGLKLGITWGEALGILESALRLCGSAGFPVTVGMEDVSRAGPGRLLEAVRSFRDMGVESVRLSDTVGALTPARTAVLVGTFREAGFQVCFHAHGDLGLAEANSLVAARAGAELVDTTLAGVGERAGNASLSGFSGLALACPDIRTDVDPAGALALEGEFRQFLDREAYLSGLAASEEADLEGFL
jgi:homocitrate synthase NifV